ncbi:hypothetical protein Tco_0406935 [Tanacetum coccineum]
MILIAYNNRFHELALMCHELVPTEKKKIERYIRGFPERIKGNITSSKPATLHEAINMARELVEQAVQGRAARIGESNKRKSTKQETENVRAYAAAPAGGKIYAGNSTQNVIVHLTSFNAGPCPQKIDCANPVGSFDVINGMDWWGIPTSSHRLFEKIVRIPLSRGMADEKMLDDIRLSGELPEVFPVRSV